MLIIFTIKLTSNKRNKKILRYIILIEYLTFIYNQYTYLFKQINNQLWTIIEKNFLLRILYNLMSITVITKEKSIHYIKV